jgi:large repetitive protein
MKMTMRQLILGLLLCSGLMNASAQVFTGTNAPGNGTNFTLTVNAGTTNLSLTLGGTASAYSYLLVRKGSMPTDTVYDFSSMLSGQTNALYLEQPEVATGPLYIRVLTPSGSQTNAFTLTVETNRTDLRSATKPVTKPLGTQMYSRATSGTRDFFRVQLTSNTFWRVRLDSTNTTAPDLYVARGQIPSESSYLKASLYTTNDVVAFTSTEGSAGVYYTGVIGSGAPGGGAPYLMRIEAFIPMTLNWDPGTTHLGTEVYTNVTGIADDYYFRINTANPIYGAWRTALRVLTNEADLYLSRGLLPSPGACDFNSQRVGSDGVVLASGIQFQPSEEWFIMVRAKAGAQWALMSGSPFVTDLGSVATNATSGSGPVEMGPEGYRFFSATAPADMQAWRLWLNGASNNIYLKKTSVPMQNTYELQQSKQMLVVPPYLSGGQYLIGVPGSPGMILNLDSRQQPIIDLAYGTNTSLNVTGYCYTTYRVQVPPNQIAWNLYLPSTNGDPNVAVRRNMVPNENYNDGYSELNSTITDNIILVPPVLSDGTFYVTVYSATDHDFELQSGPAVVTDINFIGSITNDDPARVGWRYYRVTDITNQLGRLGWDIFLTNYAPGTRLALRKNAAPSIWNWRNPGGNQFNYYDFISTADFLQRPAHQADVWYIGVYNPTNALGPFRLVTRELQAAPIQDNVGVTRTNALNGRWEFFSMRVAPEDIQGTNGNGPLLGWDVRLINVTTGSPQVVIRREALPSSLSSTFSPGGTTWPNGAQWMAGQDWTKRSYASDGVTVEDGRIIAMGVGRPLEAGTYYIGVLNSAASTNKMTYTLLSRFIGPGRAIPVQDITWNSAKVTNTIAPREAAYYRVIMPTNVPSWKVKLTTVSGEAMLVNTPNQLPVPDSEKRVQKVGNEHYLKMPYAGMNYFTSSTNFITVVGEGVNPVDYTRLGSGPNSTYVLETLGSMAEIDMGTLSSTDLVASGTLEGGEAAAYHFHMNPGSLGFWATVEDPVGNPNIVVRWGEKLTDPGLGGDLYGNEGGENNLAAASPNMIIASGNEPVVTIMVKAWYQAGYYPDASYTIRVQEILPKPLAFNGGTFVITNQPGKYESFFAVDVPSDALGWDVRIVNAASNTVPHMVVGRDILPIADYTSFSPFYQSTWPVGDWWAARGDWTARLQAADGTSEEGRILAMGMNRPLQPGRYYVGILGNGSSTVNCTISSRGIGTNYNIPATDLNFAGGQAIVTNLAPREAAYYRVYIPDSMASWKVQLSATNGESLLIASQGAIPNVGASLDTSATNTAGRKMQKLGNEQYLLLPTAGQTSLAPGWWYLAVVSEGQSPTNSQIGTAMSGFTITSLGQAAVTNLGDLGALDLLDTATLPGGDTKIYHFNVPSGVPTMVLTLENRVGNPVMALCAGPNSPDPGSGTSQISVDRYGSDGGDLANNDVNQYLLNIANPSNGVYTLIVKARGNGITWSNAAYTLRINASGTVPLNFDAGTSVIANQGSQLWRNFRIVVPTNAMGWDIRLTNVVGGSPRIVVRRESLPASYSTTPWGQGQSGTYTYWPTNYQWASGADWTRRSYSIDGTIVEDGRILAMGMGRPLEPGVYYASVYNSDTVVTNSTSYTLVSRGIGPGFSIPLVTLPFTTNITNYNLMAREAAYYRVVIPSNTVSWKVKLNGLSGESMLAMLRNALPNSDTINSSGTLNYGKSMQKLGNETFVLLPNPGETNIPPGTNYIAVIAEGVNPGNTGRIGPGSSSYVLSTGPMPVTDLGLLTSQDLVISDSAEGGESKAYQFWVPQGMYGARVRLENRVNNPVAVVTTNKYLPNPGVGVLTASGDSYGYEGGNTIVDGGATVVTLPNPQVGVYSIIVKARPVGYAWPDASYTLRLQEILVPEVNFSSNLNTNGIGNQVSGLLEDNERAYFKFYIPATNNGEAVIGWKLDLAQSNGLASMRVFKDMLPSDANYSSEMPFVTASAIIAPPYLTNGVWFVEVKASGSTAFTLKSSALQLQRPAWVMPAVGQPGQTPGVTLPTIGDTGIETNGLPIAGDQSVFLEQGFSHYYAVQIPETNMGLLRFQLEAISGNPDLYLRASAVPTLSHDLRGTGGTLYERSMEASSGTEYANWVPIDGRSESQLKPGLWYMAVRAAGNANARYRFRVSMGAVTDLPIHSAGLTNQIIAAGDWRYYRVSMPTALPLKFNVTFSQESGDVWLYFRDTVPPGSGYTPTQTREWYSDSKNYGPYPNYDAPGTYTFTTPPVRPGQPLYLGFRASSDATFSVSVTTNGTPAKEPTVVAFYGGSALTNIPPYGVALYRVDVPSEATRWIHTALHATNLLVYLEQGTLPNSTEFHWRSSYYESNSALNARIVNWRDDLKRYEPNVWPWVPGQPYFLLVTNLTAVAQPFTFAMDGKNSVTDDADTDSLPDAWEYYYWGNTYQVASGDPDNDGVSNFDEHLDGTSPIDPADYKPRLYIYATNGVVLRTPNQISYALGTTVTLTALPNPGYAFVGWAGQVSGRTNPTTVLMNGAKTVVAIFKLSGDDFVTALPLTGTSIVTYSTNVSYTKEPGEPNHAGNPGGKSIWWQWSAPGSGPVTITTAGTPFPTLLAVYTGASVSNLAWVASDINASGISSNRSTVTFTAASGVTYNIAVDGYNGASSRITLGLAFTGSVVRPRLTPLSIPAGGSPQFTFTGEPNKTYQLEYSTNLTSWTVIGPVTTSGSGSGSTTDSTATGVRFRFYRLRAP